MMVRLKVMDGIMLNKAIIKFQFHAGSIKAVDEVAFIHLHYSDR